MPSLSLAVQHLHRERLVQLPQPDVVHLQAEPVEQLRDGEDRADAHFVRLRPADRHADIAAERLEAALFGERPNP